MKKQRGHVASIAMGVLLVLCCFVYADAQENDPAEVPGAVDAASGVRDFQVWQDKLFTRTSFEEDLKDVLKGIAKTNGTNITFGEGITDTITMDFQGMPLHKAFKYLSDRYGLAHYWDGDTLHVYKPDLSKTKDVLIRLENLTTDEVKKSLERFGLLKKEIRIFFDGPTNTILLTGTEREIQNIKDVIAVLEEGKEKPVVQPEPEIRYYPLTYAKVEDTKIRVGKKEVTVKGMVSVLTEVLHLTKVGDQKAPVIQAAEGEKPQDVAAKDEARRKARAKMLTEIIRAEAGTIASDARTNQLIIRDYKDKLDQYAEIIKQLDVPNAMVDIDIIIVEASKNFARELGVGWGVDNPGDDSGAAVGTSQYAAENLQGFVEGSGVELGNLIPLDGVATPYGIGGTFTYWSDEDVLTSTIQAGETKGIAKTLHKSKVVTMDNMEAIVESKTTVTYKIQSGGDNPTVESKEIEAGIALNVTPHIVERPGETPMIEMLLEVERSSFGALSADNIPEKLATNLNTQAVIHDGQTLVLGGTFDSQYSLNEGGVPFLMNIPLLGYLFKNSEAQNPKQNLLFFLTPRIVTLDQIPTASSKYQDKIKAYEEKLDQIDPDKQERLIEMKQGQW